MRNNALSNQQELLERAREWAGVSPIRAHADRSVSGDMEAIFGPEAAPAAASGVGASTAQVRTIPVGKGGRHLTRRGRNAAIAGAGLIAVAGAALLATQVLPDAPGSSPEARQFEPLPQASRTLAPDQPALAPEGAPDGMMAATEYEESFVGVDEAGLPAPVAAPESSTGVASAVRAEVPQSSASVAQSPSPVSTAPVPRRTQEAVVPRPPVQTRVAAAPPAQARERASASAPSAAGSGLASAGQRPRPETVREARQVPASMPVTGARHVAGRIRNSDYPRAAERARVGGTVLFRFAVQPNGRVGECSVTRSSGSALLDATTCRLVQRRFRYEPARNAEGRPVPDVIIGRQVWHFDRNGPPRDARDADAPGGGQRDARYDPDRG